MAGIGLYGLARVESFVLTALSCYLKRRDETPVLTTNRFSESKEHNAHRGENKKRKKEDNITTINKTTADSI